MPPDKHLPLLQLMVVSSAMSRLPEATSSRGAWNLSRSLLRAQIWGGLNKKTALCY